MPQQQPPKKSRGRRSPRRSRRPQRSKRSKAIRKVKGSTCQHHPKRRLTGGVWTDYVPGYKYFKDKSPAEIAQAESDELQEKLGWGDYKAPPRIGPVSPVTDKQLGWDEEALEYD
jgi:hypothetical protein